MSKNPVLKNITDYLVEEGSYEEEELLGSSVVIRFLIKKILGFSPFSFELKHFLFFLPKICRDIAQYVNYDCCFSCLK